MGKLGGSNEEKRVTDNLIGIAQEFRRQNPQIPPLECAKVLGDSLEKVKEIIGKHESIPSMLQETYDKKIKEVEDELMAKLEALVKLN